MILKEKLIKALKVIGIALLIVIFIFLIDTCVIALNTPKNVEYNSYINEIFITKDSKLAIKFISDKELLITAGKKSEHYAISDIENDIVLVKDSENEEFAIKLIDNSKIYCEKYSKYMYLVSEEEKK